MLVECWIDQMNKVGQKKKKRTKEKVSCAILCVELAMSMVEWRVQWRRGRSKVKKVECLGGRMIGL